MTTNERPTPDEIGMWEPYYRAIMGSPQIAHRDKRAVHMANEQPNPDQTGAWTPDWRLLKQTRDKAITNIPYANDDQFNEQAYSAIVREYRRQQAEHGMVEVRRAELETQVRQIHGQLTYVWSHLTDEQKDTLETSFKRIHGIIAAATEQ